MKNRNKWMIGGMLLAALGIGSFFTQQTAVTAAEKIGRESCRERV